MPLEEADLKQIAKLIADSQAAAKTEIASELAANLKTLGLDGIGDTIKGLKTEIETVKKAKPAKATDEADDVDLGDPVAQQKALEAAVAKRLAPLEEQLQREKASREAAEQRARSSSMDSALRSALSSFGENADLAADVLRGRGVVVWDDENDRPAIKGTNDFGREVLEPLPDAVAKWAQGDGAKLMPAVAGEGAGGSRGRTATGRPGSQITDPKEALKALGMSHD